MNHPSAAPPALVRHNTRMVTARRPSSIAELADRATVDAWDENRDFKQYLRLAERFRKEGKECAKRGDLEGAFVELARAATLVLEKLPLHRDYDVVLNADQRRNLGLNGQDILDHLSELKPTLVDRYDKWLQRHSDGPEHERTPNARTQKIANDDTARAQAQREQFQQEERARAREREIREQQRVAAEEAAKWKQQREQQQAQHDLERAHRKEAAAAAARKASTIPRISPQPDLSFSRTPMQNAGFGSQSTVVISDGRRQEELARNQQQHQRQQEEMRLREEEIARRQAEQKRKHEQDGISRRLQEAEENAQATRRDLAVNIHPPLQYGPSSISSTISSAPSPMFSSHASSSSLATTPASSYFQPMPGHIEYPSIHSVASRTGNPPDRQNGYLAPYINPMPLESPRYDGDSTDSESLRNSDHHRRFGKAVEHRTPTRPARNPSYPPPITTTSPVPGAGMIRYPTLMSQHQLTQGYYPSLNSIFTGERQQGTSSLLFGSTGDSRSNHSAASAPIQAPYPYSSQQPNAGYLRAPPPPQGSSSTPVIPAPPPPPPVETERITRVTDPTLDPTQPLRPVSLPRECLQRFLGIAKVNTEMNMETCGLLLGKDKGHKYVVTTLLIPKQHSTSDTCTMDEEELVLQFTEERNLITLGWIHTHPSQSCFMSSVDLHTHSGFQRMLPESFAVVCAPKFEPHFGIFRLTDPPGLETILGCTTKEAFHPHPDIPIYTDADKGHVQMKDITLEIVDLR